MGSGRILVLDDQTFLTDLLHRQVELLGLNVRLVGSSATALQLLQDEHFDAVLCNPSVDGKTQSVLRVLEKHWRSLPLILLHPQSNGGAHPWSLAPMALDVLSHPVDLPSLAQSLRRALLRSSMNADAAPAAATPPFRQFAFLIGTSQPMQAVLRQVSKVAETDSNVCVYGESGTGKELVARAIHYSSRRAKGPLIVFDCTAIPEGLMESEMFGHVKGSFTSALSDRDGVFQLAEGGSLFIDEVGELSLPMQAKLLRVIQSREFRKVGGKQSIKVNVRIIAATNKNLRQMMAEGRFREDLLYRLEVIPVTIPPLRDRKEDIPQLVEHFVKRFNRHNTKQLSGVSSQAMAALLRNDWPGNVRELENCIERAAVMADGTTISAEDISFLIEQGGDRVSTDAHQPWRRLKHARHEAERDLILNVLQTVNGNRKRAAEFLGMSLRSLQYKLKALQQPPTSPSSPDSVLSGSPAAPKNGADPAVSSESPTS
jgi:two-component system, NtrC family, response regulator AtoC